MTRSFTIRSIGITFLHRRRRRRHWKWAWSILGYRHIIRHVVIEVIFSWISNHPIIFEFKYRILSKNAMRWISLVIFKVTNIVAILINKSCG
jgi:hypothetical protein